jgi:sulfur carrier protein ThiS adenylyltransferase
MTKAIIYDRQRMIYDPAEHDPTVAIIGAGNIGSNAALQLVRLGIRKFIIYDPDIIEAHNLSSQHYDLRHIGKLKVDALAEQIKALAPGATIRTTAGEYRGEKLDATILVSAVDSLDIRRDILAGLVASNYAPFVIDGRAGGGQVEVHSQEASEWGATIPEQGDTDPCGARFICYASAIVGAFIANQVKRKVLGQPLKARVLFHADTYQVITA